MEIFNKETIKYDLIGLLWFGSIINLHNEQLDISDGVIRHFDREA